MIRYKFLEVYKEQGERSTLGIRWKNTAAEGAEKELEYSKGKTIFNCLDYYK